MQSDDQCLIHIDGGFGSVVFGLLIPSFTKKVKSHGIDALVDDFKQALPKDNEGGVIDFAFKDRVLNSLPVVEADLGNLTKAFGSTIS